MKNKYVYIMITVLAAVSCVSCKDFLTETPTTLYGGSAYSSEASVEACLASIYEKMETALCGTNFAYYLQNGSRFQDWTGDRTDMKWEQSYYMTFFSGTSTNSGLYKSLYAAVNVCNSVIEGVTASATLDEDYKKETIAESRFLRAELYFILARLYGDLPLITVSPKTVEDACVKRTSYIDIYKFILKELDEAQPDMRSKAVQETLNYGGGRVCDMAVPAVRAKVYIQIACFLESPDDQFFDISKPGRAPDFSSIGINTAGDAWNKALEDCRSVIEDPKRTFSLEEDYRHLFRWRPDIHPEDYTSPERIFVIQASTLKGQACRANWTLWKNPYGTLEQTGTNSNAGRMRPNRIVWDRWCRWYGGVADTAGVYKTPTTDPRLAVTYAYKSVKMYDTSDPTKTKSSSCYPNRTGNPSGSHYFRKGYSKTYNNNIGNADYYLLRLADVYLDAAECCASLSEYDDAVQYVNVLHRRARLSVDEGEADQPRDLVTDDLKDADGSLTPESAVDRIFWEREFEEHGENHEWFITHRRGANWLIKHVLEPYNAFMVQTPQLNSAGSNSMWATFGGSKDNPPTTDFNTVRAALLCAFPDYELRYNTSLSSADQNDFYIK